ncbi:zinc ribbon domain-containing protein [Nocardioides sp. JQ2195]|uniref:NADase-type glycan-binding domain-containing protein n=1 Tax=Nocardioides sp. JQ2195 TaxID=2592334 RepID=UPI00143ED000|nr:zinc ribbon domain-containing protein [Nocardioides sp. JQ2195]QIX26330.1 zinc ribbon domain-containing protein [Nocardioides sp. JQ2195]
MEFCKNCGAGLGPGRFCTNCGMPVDQPRTSQPQGTEEAAAEKTSVRLPAVQPDASTGPRFPLYAAPPAQQPQQAPPPLFADEVPTRSPEQRSAAVPPGPAQPSHADEIPVWQPPASPAPPSGSHRSDEPGRRSPLLWLLPLLLVLLLGVGIGTWLGSRDSDDGTAASEDSSQGTGTTRDDDTAAPDDPGPGDDPADPAEAVDLTDQVKASGPAPIKPGTDLSGNRVTYPPANMLDGSPSTAYRLPGDASGRTITLELPDEATIHEVGLVNGYAKTDTTGNRTVDWYPKNRRITEVEWSFDDGTTVTQELRDSTDLQVIRVDAATTRTISLRIVSVSAPGSGPLGKNVTAISTVALRGTTS